MKTILTTKDDKSIQTSLDLSAVDAVVIDGNPANIVASKVDGDTYITDYLVQNVTNKSFYKEFGVLYRMISRAIDLKIYKLVISMPLDPADNIYRPHLQKLSNETYLYDITQRYQEINELALIHNILPMDTYEALPVEHHYGDIPEKYGCVVELNIPPIDTQLLRQELDRYVGEERPHYVSDRFNEYLIPAGEVINYLRFIGFTNEKYASYPINVQGTADINPDAPEYVKFVYGQLQSKVFRHNYVISKKGWETTWHRDHATPKTHGFRLMIPIDPVVMFFESGTCTLSPGKYYFVNNSLLHKGIIPKGLPTRANLMGQLASDVDILKGRIVLKCG